MAAWWFVEAIRSKRVGSRPLNQQIDTTISVGQSILHVFGSITEFKGESIVERTTKGLASASKGVVA